MAPTFRPAKKFGSKLRLALIGPAGSGKTYSALRVATALGGRIAVIDSERGSASLYADLFQFDVLELDSFAPQTYTESIRAAERAGYDIIIIDSLSHAWTGKGGALEIKDNVSRRQGENSFTAWRSVTPQHNEMVDSIVGSKCHVIATMRSKTEYVQEKDEKGKTVIRKVGLAPVQRDGLEYEFTVVGDLDQDNALLITKTRCSLLAGKIIDKPGEQMAEVLKAWLAGDERPADLPAPYSPPPTEAAPVTPPERSNMVPFPAPTNGQAQASLADRIRACKTNEDLARVRDDVLKLAPGSAERAHAKVVYDKRRDEIAAERRSQKGGAA